MASRPYLGVQPDLDVVVDARSGVHDRIRGHGRIDADDCSGADLSALMELGAAQQDSTRVHKRRWLKAELEAASPRLRSAPIVAKSHGKGIRVIEPSVGMVEIALDDRPHSVIAGSRRTGLDERNRLHAGAAGDVGQDSTVVTAADDDEAPRHRTASTHRETATTTPHPTAPGERRSGQESRMLARRMVEPR
jgi:hypothetical protein